jgi:NAD(P)-dependent dehydrogenase (short-subunit alcohol dehydrogenase family)
MLPRGRGSIFFTRATADIKDFARSSVFAMGKLAVRGLAQSLARELSPAGIHVVHFVIDGAVTPAGSEPGAFTPQAIAQSYMAALRRHHSVSASQVSRSTALNMMGAPCTVRCAA